MTTSTYRFATAADAQRAIRIAWALHQERLSAGADFFASRDIYKAECDGISLDAIEPAGRSIWLELVDD